MLKWLQMIRVGTNSLRLHPLRSLLTVLGIFIGVASVIWLLAIGEGISRKAQEQIEGLGATNIMVLTVRPDAEPERNEDSPVFAFGLTRADVQQILATIPTVEKAMPIREAQRKIRHKEHELTGRVVGCTPEYAENLKMEVDRGTFISDTAVYGKTDVCVLSAGAAAKLFPLEDPIGQTVYIDETIQPCYLVVIGVMKHKTASAAIGGSLAAQDYSSDIYVPIETFWNRIGDLIIVLNRRTRSFERVEVSQVTVRVDSTDDVMRTSSAIESAVMHNHPKGDVAIVVPLELLEQAKTTRLMFMLFLGMVAAVSLVVGGVGIMNIMLATVTERTVEIGIRRALGARKRDIMQQFLVETVLLSTLGGIIGLAGGVACKPAYLAGYKLLERAYPAAILSLPESVRDAAPEVVPWSIPMAFGVSVILGIAFGMYPAHRAAKMDPIVALRHA